jgi:hypothetical protein
MMEEHTMPDFSVLAPILFIVISMFVAGKLTPQRIDRSVHAKDQTERQTL